MHANRSLPRLMSPRLPIGRRWLRFCRSALARDLRAAGRDAALMVALLSAVVLFYVSINAMYAVYLGVGGPS